MPWTCPPAWSTAACCSWGSGISAGFGSQRDVGEGEERGLAARLAGALLWTAGVEPGDTFRWPGRCATLHCPLGSAPSRAVPEGVPFGPAGARRSLKTQQHAHQAVSIPTV